MVGLNLGNDYVIQDRDLYFRELNGYAQTKDGP